MRRTYKVCITYIDWNIDKSLKKNLPTSIDELTIKLDNAPEFPFDSIVMDGIHKLYPYAINNISYEVMSLEFKLDDDQKNYYINNTFTEPAFINIYKGLFNKEWTLVYIPHTPEGDYSIKLMIDGQEEDMLMKEYGEEILKESL